MVNPNAKIPAIVDHANNDFCVFESGAILQYISERCDGVLMNGNSAATSVAGRLRAIIAGVAGRRSFVFRRG